MDFVNKFEIYLDKQKKVSSSTLNAYMADIQEYQVFLKDRSKVLEKANEADVDAYIASLRNAKKSASTVNRKLSTIKSFYGFMKEEGRISKNPAEKQKSVRIERNEVSYLTISEVEKLLSKPDDSQRGLRDKALLELMYATGLRASEICEANVDDIDFRIGYINVKSSAKPRIVPIGKPAREALRKYLDQSRASLLGEKEDNGALFLSYLGQRITRQGIWKILKYYGEQAGLISKLSPQILRNSFAAHLIQNGADLKSLQDLLGHEDIMATKIYLSVSKNRIMDVYDRAFPRA